MSSFALPSNSSEPNFKAFSKIQMFLKQLAESYGNEFNDINKYYSLCKKTMLSNTTAIVKHVKLFEDYLLANKDAIKEGNKTALNNDCIAYTDKIKINLKQILARTDAKDCGSIFKHLQVIQYAINPDVELKATLTSKSKEEQFFDKMINKLKNEYEGKEDADINLGQLSNMNDLMKVKDSNPQIGGLVSELQENFESGNFDLAKMAQSAMNMVSQVGGPEAQNDPQVAGMMAMLNNLMKQFPTE